MRSGCSHRAPLYLSKICILLYLNVFYKTIISNVSFYFENDLL